MLIAYPFVCMWSLALELNEAVVSLPGGKADLLFGAVNSIGQITIK